MGHITCCFLWIAPDDTAQLSSWLPSISVVSTQSLLGMCVLPNQNPGHYSVLNDKELCYTLVAGRVRQGLLMHMAFLQVLDILAGLVPDQHGVQRAVQGMLSCGARPHCLLYCRSAVHLRTRLLWWNHAGEK